MKPSSYIASYIFKFLQFLHIFWRIGKLERTYEENFKPSQKGLFKALMNVKEDRQDGFFLPTPRGKPP